MSESDHSHGSGKVTHPSSSSTVSKPDFHPALAISNIKNHIPIVLEMEKDLHGTWAEVFRIHACSHWLLLHTIPTKDKTSPADISSAEYEQWTTLDSTILRWIYFTISTDMLTTILEPDSTALGDWNRLADIFQDNQNARSVTLEQEFSNTHMEDFPDVAVY
ncbi:polynucleotidyl transferase, partial [Trifolium medium]|nr:polynucleotidyl transferase [Trifolium medium]